MNSIFNGSLGINPRLLLFLVIVNIWMFCYNVDIIIKYWGSMFKVVDKDGRAIEYSIMGQTAAKAGQMDGTVGAGRKLTGVYVVEVPKGATGLELEFDSSFLSSGQVVVKLN